MAKKPISFKRADVGRPPRDQPWVWHSVELLLSPAWRARSINCVRLLEFLEIEHMQHAGNENGNLMATYGQLVQFGIGRRLVARTIREAERLGLIEVHRHGRLAFAKSYPTTYRLTYLAARVHDNLGASYWAAPTNDWKRFRQQTENAGYCHEGEPHEITKVNSTRSRRCTDGANQASASATSGALPAVHEGEPLYISRVGGGISVQTPIAPTSGAQHCGEELRAAVRAKLNAEGRGALLRLAKRIEVSRSHLSNYLRKHNGIGERPAALLREYVGAS